MNSFSFAPLMHTTVGFDHFESLFEKAFNTESTSGGFPHYDIEKTDESKYRITLAVAGFSKDEIEVTQKQNLLLVQGFRDKDNGNFLHRGIAARQFRRSFQLADYVEVANAGIENGLLVIDLTRELPEALKSRKINISDKTPILERVKGKVAA